MPLFSTPIDGISTTVAVARSTGQTTLTVSSAAGFGTPTSDAPVRITCVPKNTTNRVHFLVTGVSGNVLTIGSPADGYSDLALPVGSTVKVLVSAGTILELQTAILDVPSGPQGYQGSQGSTGLQGQTGSQGYQGFQGATGAGTQGSQGAQGPQGRQGFQGFQGATGTGSQGYQGFQGNQGSGGLQGSQGATGTGSQGPQGSQGSGVAAGANTDVQFNNGGAFAGSSNLTWTTSTNTLAVTGTLSAFGSQGNLRVGSGSGNAVDIQTTPNSGSNAAGLNVSSITSNGEDTGTRTAVSANVLNESTSVTSFYGVSASATNLSGAATTGYGGYFAGSAALGGTVYALGTSGETLLTGGGASIMPLVVQGYSSQTADLQEWQNSSGTVLASVNSSGKIVATSGLQVPTGAQSGYFLISDGSGNASWGSASSGPQGPQGATGTGSQGAQGSAGASGTQGPQGYQGSGVAAGSNKQIQVNSSGSFAGYSSFNYDPTNARIGIGTTTPIGRLGVQAALGSGNTTDITSATYCTTTYVGGSSSPSATRYAYYGNSGGTPALASYIEIGADTFFGGVLNFYSGGNTYGNGGSPVNALTIDRGGNVIVQQGFVYNGSSSIKLGPNTGSAGSCTLTVGGNDIPSLVLATSGYFGYVDVFQVQQGNGNSSPGTVICGINGSGSFYTGHSTTSNRPTVSAIGSTWFDTTLGIPIWYNGSNWVNASGTTV